MSLEKDIHTRLKTFATLSAYTSDRIYPVKFPQNCVKPAIAYKQINESHAHAMGTDGTFESSTYRFIVLSDDYLEAKDVAKEIKNALSRWSGQQTNVYIYNSFFRNQSDDFEDETLDFIVALDFLIHSRN